MPLQFLISRPLGRSLLLVLALSLAGCASSSARAPEPAAVPQEQAASAPAKRPLGLPAPSPTSALPTNPSGLEPPDGKWLVDELGREYFPLEVPRVEGGYSWDGEDHKRVRLAYGVPFDVASYDDEKIFVKIYRPVERPPRPARVEITPEELEAAYRVEVRVGDRLSFVPFGAGLPLAGQWRQGFDIEDINGDGHPDIVHGPARKTGSRPSLFLGDGKGNWQRWQAVFPGVPFDYGDAAAGDLDGDGHLDIVLASHLRGISALLGDGTGSFRLWSDGIDFEVQPPPDATRPAFSSREVEILDWNRDGRPDILALGEGPRLALARGAGNASFAGGSRGAVVYLNQGNGTWIKTGGAKDTKVIFSDELAVADFNGDGIQDFATGSGVQGAKTLLNLGKADGTWETVALGDLRPRAIFHGVAAGDFDRDGRADLAVGYQTIEGGVWRTGVDALFSRPDGTWQRVALGNEKSQHGIYGLGSGDLNGDGALDLVALTGGGQGWVFLGDGRGAFVREQGEEIADPGCSGYHVELADLDGDGTAEVVAGFAGEGNSLLGPEACPSQGSLRAWKAVAKGRDR